jgi:hypothetical protein
MWQVRLAGWLSLTRSTVCREPEFMVSLFVVHVRPLLDYASCVWNTGYLGDSRLLESLGNISDLVLTSESDRIGSVEVLPVLPRWSHSPVVFDYLFCGEFCGEKPYLERQSRYMGKYDRISLEPSRLWTKQICGLEQLDYGIRLRHLNIFPIKGRLLKADLIKCWKILHGDSEEIKNLFVPAPAVGTGGHSLKLAVPRRCTDLSSRFFSGKVVVLWNSLRGCNAVAWFAFI